MASLSFNPLRQRQLSSLCLSPCKYPLNLNASELYFVAPSLCPLPKHHPSFVARTQVVSPVLAKLSTADHESTKPKNYRSNNKTSSGFRSSSSRDDRLERKSLENLVNSQVKDKARKGSSENGSLKRLPKYNNNNRINPGFKQKRQKGTAVSGVGKGNTLDNVGNLDGDNPIPDDSVIRKTKKNKLNSPGFQLRVALDQCSKRGDFEGAMNLYDSVRKEGLKLEQYHYTVLLYLCSAAAVGIVQPAKSGSGSRTLNNLELVNKDSFNVDGDSSHPDNGTVASRSFHENMDNKNVSSKVEQQLSDISIPHVYFSNVKFGDSMQEDEVIRLSDDVKEYALKRGFEIYEEMHSLGIPMNEATLTSMARMAMSVGDGNMAFNMVKQMKPFGINPRLRSYGPALSTFCSSGNVEKAFEVETHMLEHGVYPEEPELELLLRVSIGASKGDKAYYLLHKLRTSIRKVSPSTADLIQKWFESGIASKLGKRKWDPKLIREATKNSGGGWHGQGWLGKGKWNVSRTSVGADGFCRCCGEKLALIDLDPIETEKFAKSVADLAMKRESKSSFQEFQKWLDYYGPFEAVIDAANVGLFSKNKFFPSKINAVVNGMRQKFPSRRWPLIVLHNRRITGGNMDQPVNRALVVKWRDADALYATPTGSNDDWYWLYAAIKFKCLIVTNDEMRDHTFQLLGNDFFPKWKERHQVHFSFSDAGPEFHMPPPCSVVIQESENGHWHIPILSGDEYEADRTWLCITRANSGVAKKPKDAHTVHHSNGDSMQDSKVELNPETTPAYKLNHGNSKNPPQETYQTLRDIFSTSVSSSPHTIQSELDAAESLGNCVIDFQI